MRVLRNPRAAALSCSLRRAGLALAASLAILSASSLETRADGEARSLTLYHNHTKESATITFRRGGQYDPRGLEQLNWFLRDWRRDESTRMDPRLFDALWEMYRLSGSNEPIHVNSAYRSPQTNAMLRRRSTGVAKNSQHMLGKAMDFYLPDVPIERIREIGMKLQHGGVGFYPNAYTPFVHLDVGSVRAWPRMSRDQLARLFPDGKTVHIPADGEPLPGYDAARAQLIAMGRTVGGSAIGEGEGTAVASAEPRRRSFWAALFGAEEDEDAEEIRSPRTRQAYVPRRQAPIDYSDRSASVYAGLQEPIQAPARAPRPAPAPQPEPEPAQAAAPTRAEPLPAPTRIAGAPTTVQTPSGPQLVWQAGPAGQAPLSVPGASAPQAVALAAPLPPRRPDDVTVTGALAYAPMPPPRPGSLAATNPIPPAPGAIPLRTATLDVGTPANVPLPPPRPAPVAVAALGPVSLPAPKPEPQPAKPAGPPAPKPAAAPPARPAPKPAATATASLLAPSAMLATGFSAQPSSTLSTDRFTGSALKPLRTP